MIALIDNYDSFSYNLCQLVGEVAMRVGGGLLGEVRVFRNDALGVADLSALAPAAIVLSPGPGCPADAGICEEVVRTLSGAVPILGVCLGHQAICEALGGTVVHAPKTMHGKASEIALDTGCALFCGLPARVTVGRYHSLEADRATLPGSLRVVAESETGEVMAVAHANDATFGLQFHPESILTPSGPHMVEGFLRLAMAQGPTNRSGRFAVPTT